MVFEESLHLSLSRDKKLDRGKFARACIIAGKMALDDRDDLELSIAMFEKAIRWYPENERLLEELVRRCGSDICLSCIQDIEVEETVP